MNISQNPVAPQDNIGYFSTLSELAFYVRKTSQAILGVGSQGVSIVMHDGIDVKQSGARQIN
jgi:hypothetical protein